MNVQNHAQSPSSDLLIVEQLHKKFITPLGEVPVLNGVSMALNPGEAVALMGESGSGKSTLLHVLAGLEAADQGQIWLNGQSIQSATERQRANLRRTQVGLIFQQFNLLPSLTVAHNIAFQARLADRFDAQWIQDLTERLALTPLLDRYPEQLSGGQQQRVAIARVLALRPLLVLADEPTGNLDEATAQQVMALFLDGVAATGSALLMATHSQHLAQQLQRRIHLQHGQVVASA
jgi:putative ABC transport system ATP-binding protein